MSSASDDDLREPRPTRESAQLVTTADEFGGRATAPMPDRASELRSEQLLHPGDVVGGRYRIDSELGRGGMGIVYSATQLGSGRKIALKWLFESAANRGERRRRFLREARAASAIEHASVVRVFDAGEHERGVFLAMELLRGESLRVYLLRNDLSIGEAVDLMMPALRGIAAAHAQGVIHRDLKPDNLLVCPREGGALELKVLDFGLSKLIGNDGDSLLTLPGAMLGTPQYMAPEQIEGSGRVDARCDLYSMAAILYEAIAGRRPFEALTLADLLAKLARDEPPSLRATARAFGKDVPEKLSQAVMRALHRDPAKRQDAIEDFALALEPFGTQTFHSTTAARDAYAQTLRTRRKSRRFAALRTPSMRRLAAVWIAAITLTVGWLAARAMMREETAPATVVHITAPPPAPAPEAAPVHPDIVLPAASTPLPQGILPTDEPSAPARQAAPRLRGTRRPAGEQPATPAKAPAKTSPRSELVDPWQ